jgi:hypothetical protein
LGGGEMELAGVITGAIALTISGILSVILAWKNYFSHFNVKVYHGNPRLEPIPHQLEDGGTVIRFSAILPLYFENTGANGGVIRDIALTVKSEKNTWLLQPFFYTKYSMQTESTLGEKLAKDPSNEPFYPIHLAGKSTVYKSIVFALTKHEKFPFGTNPLLPGKYTFEIKTLEMSEEEYKTKLTFNVELNKENVAALSKGIIFIPFLEETRNKRQQISD